MGKDEIDFLIMCCEENHEGKIDYVTFKETYYEPSKAIGFNFAVLLTNLSEHMTNDPRLAKFLETAASVLNFLNNFLVELKSKLLTRLKEYTLKLMRLILNNGKNLKSESQRMHSSIFVSVRV